MNKREILRYAIRGAMMDWEKEWKLYKDDPTNEVQAKRFQEIDHKVNELKYMLMQEATVKRAE